MSGLRSASAWNTRASMYMPVPAIEPGDDRALSGPVALAKVRGSEKMPAPTMPPTTMVVRANKLKASGVLLRRHRALPLCFFRSASRA